MNEKACYMKSYRGGNDDPSLASVLHAAGMVVRRDGRDSTKKENFFGLPWNVIDNKGPEMRKMGQMKIPWNVYENNRVNRVLPGMLLINKGVKIK